MSKRNSKGQYAKDRSVKRVGASWVSSLLSVLLVYVSGQAVTNTFGSFRSCASNNSGLYVRSCGKQALNVGDVVIIGLFLASAVLCVSVITAAWRLTKRKAL